MNSITDPSSLPSLTYRQFHSQKIGPQHPLRVIAHCDVDAAYAQFEQVRLKIPPDKPLAVQQWRGLIAVNYPAREFGITRHLPFDEAKKKCPELICVHVATYAQGDSETDAKYHENPRPETHKVSLDPYRRESVKILKIFSESCPNIEKASIDEAFLDFSVPVREILCSRYQIPTRATIQDSSEISLDDPVFPPPQLDWNSIANDLRSNVIPVESDGSEHNSWTDIALMVGAELMAQCREQVLDQLGYTCSAGIATNKLLAKLCSAYKKPNSQTVLRPAAVREFLRPFDIAKLRFLGGKLGQSVNDLISQTNGENEMNKSHTLGEVWKIPLAQLQNHLGEETGMWVWETVRGFDKSEVETKTQVKSMMSSKNFRPSISTWEEGIHWLHLLAKDLFARLKEAQQVTPGIWPKSIVMHKRDESYNSLTKQIPFPFTSQLTDQYIFSFGQRLLQDFGGMNNGKSEGEKTSQLGTVTSLGLAFHTLERIESGQRGIKGFFTPSINLTRKLQGSPQPKTSQNSTAPIKKENNPSESLSDPNAMKSFQSPQSIESNPVISDARVGQGDVSQKVAARFRSRSLTPLSEEKMMELNMIEPPKKKQKAGRISLEAQSPQSAGIPIGSTQLNELGNSMTCPIATQDLKPPVAAFVFVCERCQETVSLPNRTNDGFETSDEQERFERLKTLHLDEHFAQDVWESEKSQLSPNRHSKKASKPPTQSTSNKSSKAQLGSKSHSESTSNHGEGIKKFFKPVIIDKTSKRKK